MVQFSVEDLRTPEDLERVLRQFQQAMKPAASPTPNLPSLAQLAAEIAPLVQSSLQAPGATPLNLTALLPSAGQATILEDTHANRIALYPASNYSVGTVFYETDRTVTYAVVNSSGSLIWQYIAGMYSASFASRPTDLGVGDTGFLLWVALHNHVMKWGGTAWVFIDTQGGYFADCAADPGLGWALCDGSATSYLTISGAGLAQTAFTTPDEVTAPSGVYHKSIAVYTGTINAPTAGSISGTTGSTTATNQSNTTGITIADHGTTQITDIAGANNYAFTGSADAQHVITDPGHNHTQDAHSHTIGTLAVATTGEPRNLGVLRYVRR